MKTKHLLTITCLICLSLVGKAEGFLKVDGTKIIDARGKELILRGMGLGGWMLQEGYMLRMPGSGTQHSIKARIADLVGEEDCDKFYNLWLQNHTTRQDIDLMAQWGFNSVRLPMHYNLYTLPTELEPVSGENTWLKKGFEMTDSLLQWCKANNMYLILDLHAAPGGQGNDTNISDRDTSKPSLWESELNKQKTIALWRELARRYANEPMIGGYDLLNEPNWTFEGKHKNGVNDSLNTDLWKLYTDIIQAIREVDKTHLVIIEGNGWGNNYNGLEKLTDNNLVLSFHKYWNANNQSDINRFIKLRDKLNAPLWLGESGENSNKWFRDCIALVEKNGIGWSWWPLKKIDGINNPLTIKAPDGYEKLLSYWRKPETKPDATFARSVLFQLADNLKASHCIYRPEVIDAMFRQVNDTSTKPYAANKLPGRIQISGFDLGAAGYAYHDTENERVDGVPGQTAGNKRWIYRNDGVDIEQNRDSSSTDSNYTVCSMDDGEWLKYTVSVAKKGTYKVRIRVLPATSESVLRIVCAGQELKIELKPENKPEWKTIETGCLNLNKGTQVLKLIIDKGGIKANYIDVIK